MKKNLTCLLIWLAASSLFGTPVQAEESITSPTPRGPLSTEIPQKLKSMMLEQPRTEFLVLIDENGSIESFLPTYSSHQDLLEPAIRRLQNTEFTPAKREGNPIPMRFEISVVFRDFDQEIWRDSGQIPFGSDSVEAANRRMMTDSQLEKLKYTYTPIPELDNPLKLVKGGMVVLEDDQGNRCVGEARVEYYINSAGKALLPTILSSDNDLVAMSAIRSVAKLEFEPITRDGRPTYTRVRQTFRFGDH